MYKYVIPAVIVFSSFSSNVFSQDSQSIVVEEKELKQIESENLKSLEIAIKYLEKNPMMISQYVDPMEFKKIQTAVKEKSFDKYLLTVKPILAVKKDRYGKPQEVTLDPDYIVLQNIGTNINDFYQIENIQRLYSELYESTPQREQYQFLTPNEVLKLDLVKALEAFKILTSSQEKIQLQAERDYTPILARMNVIPAPNCSTEVGFNETNGDQSDWCSSAEFHPESLLKFSRMVMNRDMTCVKNQGARGSCVSFAINAAVESRKIRQGSNPGRFNFSEQFTYFYGEVKSGSGRYNYGLNLGNALKDFKRNDQKIPLENQWFYNPSYDIADEKNSRNQYPRSCDGYRGQMCTNYAFQGIEKDLGWWRHEFNYPAMSFTNSARIKDVDSISTFWSMTDALNTVIALVNDKKPVLVSFTVYSNFMDAPNHGRVQKSTNKSALSNKKIGGHAAVLVGYVSNSALPAGVPKADEKGYFIMKNSWGIGNGDCGFYYVDYKYLRSYASSFYKINVK
jgi:C1A family cysteine protease